MLYSAEQQVFIHQEIACGRNESGKRGSHGDSKAIRRWEQDMEGVMGTVHEEGFLRVWASIEVLYGSQ